MKKLFSILIACILLFSCSTSNQVSKATHKKKNYMTSYSYQKQKNNFSFNFKRKETKQVKKPSEHIFLANRFKNTILQIENKFTASLKTIPINLKPIYSEVSTKKLIVSDDNVVGECDIIILNTGEEIEAKVLEVSDDAIKYKMCDNKDGPTFSKSRSAIFKIKYANGSESLFSNQSVQKYENGKTDGQKIPGLAVAGFVLAILGLFIFGFIFGSLGVIFSAIGLSKINSSPDKFKGKGLAIAGLIIGIIAVIGWLIFILLFL